MKQYIFEIYMDEVDEYMYIRIDADSEAQARELFESKYPHMEFDITSVTVVDK